jgi:HAD superfamily hydrolase (TIGR01509 family)
VIGPIEALVFDVDGTLAETEEAHRLSFNQAFREAGLDWDWTRELYTELLKVTGGKERIAHYIDSGARFGLPGDRAAGIKALHARKTVLYADLMAAGEVGLRPGVAALISEAKTRGLRLAIATTTSRPNVDALLTATLGEAAIRDFDPIACGDMVEAKKPAPDIYRLAMERLGLPPARALALEDSRNGVLSAKSAGLKVAASPSLYSAKDDVSDADVIVADLSEIRSVLGWM